MLRQLHVRDMLVAGVTGVSECARRRHGADDRLEQFHIHGTRPRVVGIFLPI
jgi:hypothetical protein